MESIVQSSTNISIQGSNMVNTLSQVHNVHIHFHILQEQNDSAEVESNEYKEDDTHGHIYETPPFVNLSQ